MAKTKTAYICTECGTQSPKWSGKCPGCGEWNTMREEVISPTEKKAFEPREKDSARAMALGDIDSAEEQRYLTGLTELDRVLGGGIVKGSLVLLGGDPGIGKSTIMLQICDYLGRGCRILYVSGEESARQIGLRAARLKVESENLMIMAETDIGTIIEHIRVYKPDIAVVDSIQTMNLAEISSSPGSVTQVRECTNALLRIAKNEDVSIFVVGHVNKDGAIAGPKVLEHIVDAVLYFEGERNLSYRILRAVKNRYGSTNEIGVFEMRDSGLYQVENPSMLLLSGRPKDVSGTCVACVMEGSRPILAEVQALVTATGFGNPRRMATGVDYNRFNLLLAVLEKRAGYYFSNLDAYINVVGGLKLDETAADLSVALALVSGLKDFVIPEDVIAFGEIGLGGEIRAVSHIEQRVSEASRMGLTRCIIPCGNLKSVSDRLRASIHIDAVRSIRQACAVLMK
ncbi:MAG TPA: DNA repair protein RadA [Ruminococcaceae bacterium]|nr:DNA repair protein RadA [Oscillospiraceae bacterium]